MVFLWLGVHMTIGSVVIKTGVISAFTLARGQAFNMCLHMSAGFVSSVLKYHQPQSDNSLPTNGNLWFSFWLSTELTKRFPCCCNCCFQPIAFLFFTRLQQLLIFWPISPKSGNRSTVYVASLKRVSQPNSSLGPTLNHIPEKPQSLRSLACERSSDSLLRQEDSSMSLAFTWFLA